MAAKTGTVRHRVARWWSAGMVGTACLFLAVLACYGGLALAVLLPLLGLRLVLDEGLWGGAIVSFTLLTVLRRAARQSPAPVVVAGRRRASGRCADRTCACGRVSPAHGIGRFHRSRRLGPGGLVPASAGVGRALKHALRTVNGVPRAAVQHADDLPFSYPTAVRSPGRQCAHRNRVRLSRRVGPSTVADPWRRDWHAGSRPASRRG